MSTDDFDGTLDYNDRVAQEERQERLRLAKVLEGEAPYKNRKQAAKKRRQENWSPSKEDWDSLTCSDYSRDDVKSAVNNIEWQKFRVHLLGMSHSYRHHALYRYLHEMDGVARTLFHTPEEWQEKLKARRIHVSNYVHALRRGGLIP